MKIKICKCPQCRAKRRTWSKNRRKRFRRMTSKARRRMKIGETKVFYPA